MTDLEPRLRELEVTMASHVADCTQYRRATAGSLKRIEVRSREIKQVLAETSKKLDRHLGLHKGRKAAWSDTRVLIGVGIGVAGIIWGIIQTLL